MKTLPTNTFIKPEALIEAIDMPAMIQYGNQRTDIKTPDEWYKELRLDKLERSFGLPNQLLRHIIEIESHGNPNKTSRAGAKGIFGITPGSGYNDDPLNHHKVAWFVANMLKNHLKHYVKMGFDRNSDAMEKTIAAYNWGMGKLARNNYSTHKDIPRELRNYIQFMKDKGVIKPKEFIRKPIPSWFFNWQNTKNTSSDGPTSTLK